MVYYEAVALPRETSSLAYTFSEQDNTYDISEDDGISLIMI